MGYFALKKKKENRKHFSPVITGDQNLLEGQVFTRIDICLDEENLRN